MFADVLLYMAMTAIVAILWLFVAGLVLALLDFAKTVIEDWFY
jgi:hypothetical protein